MFADMTKAKIDLSLKKFPIIVYLLCEMAYWSVNHEA